ATRAGKRQAAPFTKGEPKPVPRKPGRKPGKDYTAATRVFPTHCPWREPLPLLMRLPHLAIRGDRRTTTARPFTPGLAARPLPPARGRAGATAVPPVEGYGDKGFRGLPLHRDAPNEKGLMPHRRKPFRHEVPKRGLEPPLPLREPGP